MSTSKTEGEAPIQLLTCLQLVQRAATEAEASGDRAAHSTLCGVEIAFAEMRHRLGEAAKTLRGEPLELVRRLQERIGAQRE